MHINFCMVINRLFKLYDNLIKSIQKVDKQLKEFYIKIKEINLWIIYSECKRERENYPFYV